MFSRNPAPAPGTHMRSMPAATAAASGFTTQPTRPSGTISGRPPTSVTSIGTQNW